jgi:hypothetical protein
MSSAGLKGDHRDSGITSGPGQAAPARPAEPPGHAKKRRRDATDVGAGGSPRSAHGNGQPLTAEEVQPEGQPLTAEEGRAAVYAFKLLIAGLEGGRGLEHRATPHAVRTFLREMKATWVGHGGGGGDDDSEDGGGDPHEPAIVRRHDQPSHPVLQSVDATDQRGGRGAGRKRKLAAPVDVKECDIARYTIADLSFGALGRIQRVANKRYPIGRGECKNYNGGVITAEPSCTERACRACANPLRTTTSSLALNDQARYALWIEAKVPTITPVVRD